MSAWIKFWRESHIIERIAIIGGATGVLFFSGYLFRAQNQPLPLPPLFEETRAPVMAGDVKAGDAPGLQAKRPVTVHVVGAVKHPGVLTLPPDARVQDAIRAAGGPLKIGDPGALNLASRLEDGGQIRVPTHGEITAANTITPSPAVADRTSQADVPALSANKTTENGLHHRSKALPPRVVNINTASAADLELLPGIGPALAARIVAYREQHGRLNSLADLDAVNGIGPKKLEKLRPYVTF